MRNRRVLGLVLSIVVVFTSIMGSIVFGHTENAVTNGSDDGVIGWDGDNEAPIVHMDGSFHVGDGKELNLNFGIYNNPSTLKWYNHSGYLPCLVTEFERDGATIKIQNFGDKVILNGNDYVAVYSRVSITNNGVTDIVLDPQASQELIKLTNESFTVPSGATVNHDFVIAADRFGNSYNWPSDDDLINLGSWDQHFSHMEAYWDTKLSGIVDIKQLPDERLINAYKAGYIYTHIIKDGDRLCVGENGYGRLFDHDFIGSAVNLMLLGDHDLKPNMDEFQRVLDEGRNQYPDAIWKFAWPYAVYLWKTDDVEYLNDKFQTIKKYTHMISTDRTGPNGTMKMTDDVDSHGHWTIDNQSALMGLASYKYICERLDYTTEAQWAQSEYDSILQATNEMLTETMTNYQLPYIPASVEKPNTQNFCSDPKNANWASMFLFGRWTWDAHLLGINQSGPMIDNIDATYEYGLNRLEGIYSDYNFGNLWNYYSGGYNAGYASAALRGEKYRTYGIKAYQFMIDELQASPFGFWEGIGYPVKDSPWEGLHPIANNNGSGPHMCGQSTITKILMDSIISEKADGSVIIGRGIPNEWVISGEVTELDNYPLVNNKRMGLKIEGLDGAVRLTLTGDQPSNATLELPALVNNIDSVSAGSFDSTKGIVTLPAGITEVTVNLINSDFVEIEKFAEIDFGHKGESSYTFGQITNQVKRYQTFVAGVGTKINNIELKLKKQGSFDQNQLTVELYEVQNSKPTGNPLVQSNIPSDQIIRDEMTLVEVPLTYDGLIQGKTYAIALGQETPMNGTFAWYAENTDSTAKFGKWTGSEWVDESFIGDGWMRIYTNQTEPTEVPIINNIIDLSHNGLGHYTFGQNTDQVKRYQTFMANEYNSLSGVDVKIKKFNGSNHDDVTVELYATTNGKPTGTALGTAIIPVASINNDMNEYYVDLGFTGLVQGNRKIAEFGRRFRTYGRYRSCATVNWEYD